MRTTIMLGLAAIGLSGCVAYEPRPLDPRAELAALDLQALPEAVRLGPHKLDSTELSRPFDLTDGLSDQELMAVAVALNPRLRAARASIGESEALLIKAQTLPNPAVGFGFGLGVAGTGGFLLDMDLLLELLKPDERAARQAVAEAQIECTRAGVLAQEYAVATEVRRLGFEVLIAEHAAAAMDDAIALRHQASELLRKAHALGEANDMEVNAIDLELVEAQRDQRLGRAAVEQARIALNGAIGLPPHYTLRLEGIGKPLEVSLEEVPSESRIAEGLLSNRLDLKARERQYQLAEEELRLAVSGQYAKVAAGPLYSHEGTGQDYAGVSASVEIPIFDRNQGGIAETTAARDRVRAEYVAELQRLLSEAASAVARARAFRVEIDTQQREVMPLLERSQTLLRAAFEARELNVLDWVTAQQRSLRTRRAYLDTLIAYRRALLEIEALSGFPVWRLVASEPGSESITLPKSGSNP